MIPKAIATKLKCWLFGHNVCHGSTNVCYCKRCKTKLHDCWTAHARYSPWHNREVKPLIIVILILLACGSASAAEDCGKKCSWGYDNSACSQACRAANTLEEITEILKEKSQKECWQSLLLAGGDGEELWQTNKDYVYKNTGETVPTTHLTKNHERLDLDIEDTKPLTESGGK